MEYGSILVRSAVDDFWAMRIADAMQGLRGVEVISIVYSGQDPKSGSVGWHVFAKFASYLVSIDQIDAAIDEAYKSA